MTQSAKLEIIGPYTPQHEGPFCTRDGKAVRLITRTDGGRAFPIIGIIDDDDTPDCWTLEGRFFSDSMSERDDVDDLMNARAVLPGESIP